MPRPPALSTAVESRVYSRIAFWFLAALLGIGFLTFLATLFSPRLDRFTPLAYVIISIPFAVRFVFSRKHFIGYQCRDRVLLFYKDKPSARELTDFLVQLQQRRTERLKSYFLGVKSSNPADQLEKLAWLQKQGSITEEEFRRLKESIIGRPSSHSDDPEFRVN